VSENSPVIKLKAKERGQGLVEFALILPLFLLLVWGIIEFGRLLVMYTEVSNAAREAVRYGVARGLPGEGMQRYLNCDKIVDYGQAVTAMVGLQDGDFEIGYDRGDGVVYSHCIPEPGEQWPPDVRLGDRMVVTVTHEIRPLVLFQNAGPFRMQFTAARTIVHAGMPMERVGSEGGIEDAPTLEFHRVDDVTCSGYFTWSEIPEAEVYVLYQTVPIAERRMVGSTTQDNEQYPIDAPATLLSRPELENGQEYRVLASNVSGDGPLSNIVEINGCMEMLPGPDPFNFGVENVSSPCDGTFNWGSVDGAIGYRLYEDGSQLNDYGAATSSGPVEVGNGRAYTVRAYDAVAEGYDSAPIIMSACQPDPPENLAFVVDRGTPPCEGHLDWDDVFGADTYYVYKNGDVDPVGTSAVSRYPASGPLPGALNGDLFEVTAYNTAGDMMSDRSQVTVTGCWIGSEVAVTYWLHSNPTPPNWHGDAPPPLTMNETPPSHNTLYNYNGSDPGKPGREVAKGGGTPPGETDPDDYLAWYSPSPNVPMTFRNDAILRLWGRNTQNQVLVATAYLYAYNGSAYTLLASATEQWGPYDPEPPALWREATFNFDTFDGVDGDELPAGSQLVVWLVSDSAKSLHFAYDTSGNHPSRLEFTGQW
jgi:hypothetical protein